MKRKTQRSAEKIAIHVSIVSIIINLVLSLVKFLAGILAHSGAMISDAIHSASDVGSTLIVIAGMKVSCKASDQEHEYGHERMECIAAIILAGLLLATGLGIGASGVQNILKSANGGEILIPGRAALLAALLSIVVKEWMFWYAKAAARQIKSAALMADAWHHRSDAISSIGAFVGIAGSRMGFPILDSLASLAICLLIGKAAIEIFRDAVNGMVDHSCTPELEQQMHTTALSVDGVSRVDLLQTRLFGSKIYVDIEIAADGTLPLYQAHDIAESVHHALEDAYPDVKHCMVHVNPQ